MLTLPTQKKKTSSINSNNNKQTPNFNQQRQFLVSVLSGWPQPMWLVKNQIDFSVYKHFLHHFIYEQMIQICVTIIAVIVVYS